MTGYSYDQGSPQGAVPMWEAGATGAQNITTNASTNLSASTPTPQVFYGINVNTAGTTSTAKVYDGVDNTGKLLGTFDTTKVGPTGRPVILHTGLFVVTAGGAAADITVLWH